MKMYKLLALVTAFCCLELQAESKFSPFNVIIKSFQVNSDGKSNQVVVELARMEHGVTGNLERSTDGVRFNSIKTFELEEGFSGTLSYSDKDVKSGTYYYRIRLSKLSYKTFTSNIISVKIAGAEANARSFRIQNPFTNSIVVNGDFGDADRVRVELSDMNGKVRLVKVIDISPATKSINIPASGLNKGMYIIRVKQMGSKDGNLLVTQSIYKNAE